MRGLCLSPGWRSLQKEAEVMGLRAQQGGEREQGGRQRNPEEAEGREKS